MFPHGWSKTKVWKWVCVHMCEEPHMTAPATVRVLPSFFCWVTPENVVGMTTEREIMKRQRLQERMREDRRSERQKERKRRTELERDGVMEPADVKVPLITSCFSSTPSPCLSLSVLLSLSFRSHLNSSPSASLRRDVGFWSPITTEMRQPRPTHARWTHTH